MPGKKSVENQHRCGFLHQDLRVWMGGMARGWWMRDGISERTQLLGNDLVGLAELGSVAVFGCGEMVRSFSAVY